MRPGMRSRPMRRTSIQCQCAERSRRRSCSGQVRRLIDGMPEITDCRANQRTKTSGPPQSSFSSRQCLRGTDRRDREARCIGAAVLFRSRWRAGSSRASSDLEKSDGLRGMCRPRRWRYCKTCFTSGVERNNAWLESSSGGCMWPEPHIYHAPHSRTSDPGDLPIAAPSSSGSCTPLR